jgi:hypothetical protein
MSTIGGTTVAGLNLAGSIVGSSRPEAVSEPKQASIANQTAPIDQDVADAEFSTERDADGRRMYERPSSDQASAEAIATDSAVVPAGPVSRHHSTDAFGDRGTTLDIDA